MGAERERESMSGFSQTSVELFARLTVASNDTLGRYVERKRQRRTVRVDFTTPGFEYPTPIQ